MSESQRPPVRREQKITALEDVAALPFKASLLLLWSIGDRLGAYFLDGKDA